MRFALQARRNEHADVHGQEVFKVRDRNRDVRILRSAGLSGHYLLSMCERRISRSGADETDHSVPTAEVTIGSALLSV